MGSSRSRRSGTSGARLGLALVACTVALGIGCAAVQANRRSPGVLENGAFSPTRPPAAQYGPQADLLCPVGGAFAVMADDLATIAKDERKPAPQGDGRLCAMADTLLGWNEKEIPPESVIRFLASYFGVANRIQRVVVTVLETEDSAAIAQRLEQPAQSFTSSAKVPRFGAATLRVRKGATKVALVLQDALVDLQPVPRQVPAGSQVALAGTVTGDYDAVKVVASNTVGKLETPAPQPGKAFRTAVSCGDHPGRMVAEVRGERDGIVSTLASLTVACGGAQPKSVALAPPDSGPLDDLKKARKLLDLMNEERSAAGMSPLGWDDAVAGVARGVSERFQGNSASSFDIVGALKAADVASPIILQNAALATTVEEANATINANPIDRANVLSSDVTHAGIGVVPATAPDGRAVVYVTELLVREMPPADLDAVRSKLRGAIAQRRADARVGPMGDDALLDQVAQSYAELLAASKGAAPKAKEDAILAPLYKAFRTVNVTAGVKVDPVEFAQEPAIVSDAKLVGIGAANGTSAALGKNSVFVVVLTGTRR